METKTIDTMVNVNLPKLEWELLRAGFEYINRNVMVKENKQEGYLIFYSRQTDYSQEFDLVKIIRKDNGK